MEADTMKTFDKSSKLDNVLYDVRGPVVDEAARMEADGLSILKLNIGGSMETKHQPYNLSLIHI